MRGVAGDEVSNVLLVVRLKHERLLHTPSLHLVAQLQRHVVVVGVDGDGVDVQVLEVVDDKLVLGADELDAVHVDGQEGVVSVGPQTFVQDREEGAAVQRELFDARQVPHLRLQLALLRSVMLHKEQSVHHLTAVQPSHTSSPATSLGFTTLGETFAYVTVSNPTLKYLHSVFMDGAC